jgi:hypothetical protein
MYGEITAAVGWDMPVRVFNKNVFDGLRERFICDGMDPEHAQYDAEHPHFVLSWGSDELAPYWETGAEKNRPVRMPVIRSEAKA